MPGIQSKMNGKKGGRPAGTKNPVILERQAIMERIKQRTMGVADLLFDSQLTLARGQTFLYRIDKEWIKTGTTKAGKENGYYRNKKPVLVESQFEIEEYLEGRVSEGDDQNDQDPGAAYYFLTTKEPNNQALDSIYDRTFGKSMQSVEVTGPNGGPVQVITGIKIVREDKKIHDVDFKEKK